MKLLLITKSFSKNEKLHLYLTYINKYKNLIKHI